jgi:hypothetical protein
VEGCRIRDELNHCIQQFPPIKFAIPTRVASFDHPDWIFKVEAAMPKRSRRWPAKPVLVGSSPTATSISFELIPHGHGPRVLLLLLFVLTNANARSIEQLNY